MLAELRLSVEAEPARAAGDRERHDDTLAERESLDRGSAGLHDADRLVADRLSGLERGLPVEEVEVAAADARDGDADERVTGLLHSRVGDLPDGNRADALVDDGLHVALSR